MELTLSNYADLVISNVYGGYKGVTNNGLSKDAVMAEFVLGSRRMIKELHAAQRLDPEDFYQTLPKIKLEKLSDLSEVPIPVNADPKKGIIYWAEIPELIWMPGLDPVDYIGPFNRFYHYVVKKGNTFVNHAYSKFHAKEPAVWVKGSKVYVMNNLKGVSILQMRALLKDPTVLLDDDQAYPIPSEVGDMLVTKMTEQYLRYFRLMNPQPNTQNDITPQTQASE
jgi:hypothetical protein